MHLRFVHVHSKRSFHRTSKQHITFAHRPFFACTEPLFGNASFDTLSRAAFRSISSQRRMFEAPPPPEESPTVESRRHKTSSSREESSSYQQRNLSKSRPAREAGHPVQVRRKAKTPPGKVVSDRNTTVGANGALNERFTDKSTAHAVSCNLSLKDCVRFYSDWWISCFKNTGEYFKSLEFPLANIEIWALAYHKIYLEVTGDRANVEAALRKVIPNLLKLKNLILAGSKYRWADPTRVFLSSPDLGTMEEPGSTLKESPSPYFQDTVVQEALLLTLEPIFEARFSNMSHASRPGRSAHTAIKSIHRSFAGCVWFIKGDCGMLNNHLVLIRVLDSVTKVVMDFRIADLIKAALLPHPHAAKNKAEKVHVKGLNKHLEGHEEELVKGQVLSRLGANSRLMPFLHNVLLDQLDCWMDERIQSLYNKKASLRRSSSLLFKPATIRLERRCRTAYVRYGTQFLFASSGPQKDVEEIKSNLRTFLYEKLGVNLIDDHLTVSHISTGVIFLDHVISQKVVHPVLLRRTASNGFVMEKKVFGIVLSIKASRQCCMFHLQKMGSPSSTQEISELLSVLKDWYRYAENRKQAIKFCKFKFCCSYVKRYCQEHEHHLKVITLAKFYREAMNWMDEIIVVSDLDKVYPIHEERNWVPKHEKYLRNLVGMQRSRVLGQGTGKLLSLENISPQQNMSRLVWQFLGGFYPIRSDYFVEPEIQLQTNHWSESFLTGSKGEVLVNSAA